MLKKTTEKRKELLLKLESIIGSSCYNGNIQNYGPGGEWEGEGREFRYPITFVDSDRNRVKTRYPQYVPGHSEITESMLENGYYAFGANELHIMRALIRVLDVIEDEYGIDFD